VAKRFAPWAGEKERIVVAATKTSLTIETIAENNGAAPLSSPASLALSRNHKTIYVANLNESGGLVQEDPDNPLLVEVTFPVPVHAWNSDCG
jgi:hypothetical protein